MPTVTNKLVLGGIAAALVAAFVVAAWLYRPAEPPPPSAAAPVPAAGPAAAAPALATDARLIRDYSPVLGPADAPVTIVEFLDPECESCAAMHPIVKDVLREFEGKVRLVVRYMPLHGNSAYASGLLEGARAHGRYWELMEVFFARQPEWASHHAPRPDLLVAYVGALGLDVRGLEEAARSAEIARRIQQDRADGVAFRVTGTPTFFVNGHMQMHLGHAPLRQAVIQALGAR